MRSIDTNVLVRLIARDDAKQLKAAEHFVEKGGWVSVLALAETTGVLATVYERRPEDIATAVEMLLKHRTISLQDSEVVAAALNAFRKHPSLGYSDCLLLEFARRTGHLPLGTFDRNLGKLDGAEKL
jgi:predicted nucleic-acid-binding protein